MSLLKTLGLRRRWLKRPARNPAVVSVPAILERSQPKQDGLLVGAMGLHEQGSVDNDFVSANGTLFLLIQKIVEKVFVFGLGFFHAPVEVSISGAWS